MDMSYQPSDSYKEHIMKDVNRKRQKEGLESITFEQHINNIAEKLKRNAERYKEATKYFDWSKVGSWYCGGSDIEEKDGCQNYMYDRKSKKYFKITKEN